MVTVNSNWQLKLERPVIVFFYRLLGRWIGSRYRILLLTTTGRKSQRQRTVPLVYMPLEGNFVVIAANVGSDLHPGWYINVKHNSQAHIQIGSMKLVVVVDEAPVEDRERLWHDWLKINPGYQEFQEKTARKFPMVILKPAIVPIQSGGRSAG
jgi:F420H(2)-dependent quinone reductase